VHEYAESTRDYDVFLHNFDESTDDYDVETQD
jgi:hypothetical protein